MNDLKKLFMSKRFEELFIKYKPLLMIAFCRFASESKHIENQESFMFLEYRKLIIIRWTLLLSINARKAFKLKIEIS